MSSRRQEGRHCHWWSCFASLAAVVGMLVLACGTGAAASPRASSLAGKVPHLSYKGTITMFAWNLTPSVKGVKLPTGTPKLKALEKLAKQFEKLYPGIHIKFVYATADSTLQTQETLAAGGKMPDVWWTQYGYIDNTLPTGIAVNLKPYFEKPDPYIPGNKKWGAVMDPAVLSQIAAPNGDIYLVDGDWVGQGFFYNVNLFKKAGIHSAPQTWGQLIGDVKKLKSHGINPGASTPTYSWWARDFLGNFIPEAKLSALEKYGHTVGSVSIPAQIHGYKTGVLNPAKNSCVTSWWKLVKGLYKYFDPDVTDLSPTATLPSSTVTDMDLFEAGKVALNYEGSWLPEDVKLAHGKFPVAYFAFPTHNKGLAGCGTDQNSSFNVGGPSGAYQFAVSSQKADSTMTPQKLKAVMDWVKFFSTPKRDQEIVNELDETAPTFKGTHAGPGMNGEVPSGNALYVSLTGFDDLSSETETQSANLFAEYVSGHISFSAAQSQFESMVQTGISQFQSRAQAGS